MFITKILPSFRISKMANSTSVPLHESTVNMWQYGNDIIPNQFKVTSWNVNGIRSVLKKGQLQKYLKQNKPDFISFSQTKIDLKAFNLSKNSIKEDIDSAFKAGQKINYYWYWNFCKVSSGYSGVMTLTKFKPLRSDEQFPLNHWMRFEGRCQTLQYENFFYVNVYKPNSGANLERLSQRIGYDEKFTEFVKQLSLKKPVVICGDMNVAHHQIDIAKPKQNERNAGYTKEERASFSNMLRQSNLVDSYRHLHPLKREYSWWNMKFNSRQKNIGWRIDYILVNGPLFIKQAKIRTDVMGSDHCPIETEIQFKLQ